MNDDSVYGMGAKINSVLVALSFMALLLIPAGVYFLYPEGHPARGLGGKIFFGVFVLLACVPLFGAIVAALEPLEERQENDIAS